MAKFGKASLSVLDTLSTPLQNLCLEAIKHVDFSLICGHRNKASQDAAYAAGNSKLKWPKSKHNSNPSRAFDFQPYPNGDIKDYIFVAGIICGIARTMKIKIRYGYDWNENDRVSDESFADAGHIEER